MQTDKQIGNEPTKGEMMTISKMGKTLFISFVILGIICWIILVIPDLHFLYKDYLASLDQLKLVALLLAAVGMFFAMPVWLVDRLYQCLSLKRGRYLIMAIACLKAVFIGKALM